MIEAADICAKMPAIEDIPTPANERQVRPLRALSGENAAQAWSLAVNKANGHEPTGNLVRESVLEISAAQKPKEEKLTWQINIEPLLKRATAVLKRGDRDEFELLIEKISCLLMVGRRPHAENDTPHSMQ